MTLYSLALRNLRRNRRRSIMTLLSMTVGLVAILLFGGYRSNIIYGTQTAFIQYSGHLQIQRKGYFRDGGDSPLAYGIAAYRPLLAAIAADPVLSPMLEVLTPTLQLGGIAGSAAAGDARSVIATGLVPEESNRMLMWNEYGVLSYARPLPLAGTSDDTVVVGTGLARKLRLCALLPAGDCAPAPAAPEDGAAMPDHLAALAALEQGGHTGAARNRIDLLAASVRGAPNVASLRVIKANNMGIKALDDVYMAMHLPQAQRLIYGRAAPQVTAILIQLRHTAQLEVARQRLNTLLFTQFGDAGLEVLDYQTLNPIYGQTKEFMDSMFGFIALLIAVIVLFTIGNTMSAAVIERTVEIGTLRAMGLRRAGIRRLFICEALLLGLAGAAIGLLWALAIAELINHSGWSWIPPGYSYAYLIHVRIWQDLPLLAGSVLGMTLVTVLSAWWPASRAARLAIVDALRHQ